MQKTSFIIFISLFFQFTIQAQKHQTTPAFLLEGHAWADSVMGTLSLDEKIGQLIMIDAYTKEESDNAAEILAQIEQYHIGGVIFFAGSPNKQIASTHTFQQASKIPLMVAMDAEYGASMRLDSAIRYPYNLTLGAIQDANLLYEFGREMGQELKSLGVHINFAPVVDVNNNPANPIISWRSLGDDPAKVALAGWEIARGMESVGVMATAKHFPGHGDTDIDSHADLPILPFTRERLDSIELVPFRHVIDRGISGMMIAHMHIPTLAPEPNMPTTLSKKFTTDILKNELGFQGLVFTDALNMKGVTNFHDQETIGVKALLAGNDVLLFPADIEKMILGIKKAVQTKSLPAAMIEEKCRKVLLAKYWFGLHDSSKDTKLQPWKIMPSGQMLHRRLIENSITVLKNQEEIVPLRSLDTLRVASLAIGREEKTAFQSRLEDYMPIDHFFLPKDASPQMCQQLLAQLEDYNLVVVGLHSGQKYPWNTEMYAPHIYEELHTLANQTAVIGVHFRHPYLLTNINTAAYQALLTTYQDDELTEDYAAQVIFGGIGAKGKLPVRVNDEFPANHGIATQGDIRFKYTIPEELGIDGKILDQRISKVMEEGIEEKAFPGGQVFLAKDQKVFYHKSFGHHTYESERRVQKNDIFDLASITKISATTAALMDFHDRGLLSLDATLKDYFPYLRFSNKKNIVVRNALTHNAGIQSWIAYYKTTTRKNGKYKRNTLSSAPSTKYTIQLADDLYLHSDYRQKLYKMIKKSPVEKTDAYVYSDLPFYLFYEYIDRTTGDFEGFLEDTFYRPLGAGTLMYNPQRKFPLDRIVPTEMDDYFRNRLLHGVVHDEGAAMLDGVSGHAGLFGTANDLAKLWQMYLNFGEYGGQRYILQQTLRKFTACQYCENDNRRGLAFDKPEVTYDAEKSSVAKEASFDTFGHSGYTGTLVWADPAYDLLYIFLSNRVHPTRDSRKIYTLNIRPAIHNIVYEEMLRDDR